MLALACSAEQLGKGGTPEDRALLQTLRERSIPTDLVAWDDPGLVPDRYQTLWIRSCWDYHRRLGEFLETLRRIESAGVAVWNSPEQVAWNSDKRYLRDLESAGVEIVPTVFLEPGGEIDTELLSRMLGTSGGVIKPSIGATASGLERVLPGRENAAWKRLRSMVEDGAWLVQPYLEEIAAEGEWSLVYLGGALSHAVLKKAASGEFRVQKDFGGSVIPRPPPPEVVRAADTCLQALDTSPAYARVDLVRVHERVLLMELELIEPELYLDLEAAALDRMVELVAGLIS